MPSPVLHAASAPTRQPDLGFVPPLIPTLADEPPAGEGWIHEIKRDGHRTLIVTDRGQARAFTRNGHDWTERYSRVVDCARNLGCQSAVLDGEIVVQDERGVSDFPSLRRAMADEPHRIGFFAFDLLHLYGRDLRGLPLLERRAKLQLMIGPTDPFCPIQFSDKFHGSGAELFAAADQMGLEGIVSNGSDSKYRSGRSTAWLKTKCMTESQFVVIGTEWQPGHAPFALLARQDSDGLIYVGSAFITLARLERDAFWTRAEALSTTRPVLSELRKHKANWCRPEMVVRVRHVSGPVVFPLR